MASGIKSVAAKTGWLDEKFLKHIVKNYSGKDFTLSDFNEDPVISKFMSPSKKVSNNTSKPRPLKASPMKFLRENPDTLIKFNQENPKRSNSKVYELYENYKKATTYAEFSEMGFSDDKLTYDYKHGFVQIEDYEAPVVISPEKKVEETSKSEEADEIEKADEVEKVEEVEKVLKKGKKKASPEKVEEVDKVVEKEEKKKEKKKVKKEDKKKVKKTTKDMSDTVVEPELEEDTSEDLESSEPTPVEESVEESIPVEENAEDSDEEIVFSPLHLNSDTEDDSEDED
tara:strand:+ start:629 stop:1483 length:855 start_codon:yes stop_codon:yes gene_type:complete